MEAVVSTTLRSKIRIVHRAKNARLMGEILVDAL